MRIYFAHPIITYNSFIEERSLNIISNHFNEIEIINPSDIETVHMSMETYHRLIDSCDIVVFITIGKFITAGVYSELKHALKNNKMVYHMDWRTGEISEFKKTDLEKYIDLTIEETKALFKTIKLGNIDEAELEHAIEKALRKENTDINNIFLNIIENTERLPPHEDKCIKVNPLSRYYHWWQEPKNTYILIDPRKMKEILLEKISEEKCSSLLSFLKKKGIDTHRGHYYKYYLREKIKRPYVRSLKRMCKEIGISFYELERKVVLGYPVDISNPYLWKLASHILNEGHIKYKSKDVVYVNKDPVMHWYVMKNLENMGGKVTNVVLRHYGNPRRTKIETYIDVKTGRILNYIGVPYGDKAVNQPTINLGRMSNEVWRYHLQTTLTEEGYAKLEIVGKGYLRFRIEWSRTIDVTDYISKDAVENIPYGLIKIRKSVEEDIIDKKTFMEIMRHPPKLLVNEVNELKKGIAKKYRRTYILELSQYPYIRLKMIELEFHECLEQRTKD